jgi:hypothetical protein
VKQVRRQPFHWLPQFFSQRVEKKEKIGLGCYLHIQHLFEKMCVCVCVCERLGDGKKELVCVRVWVCVCGCVCACVSVRQIRHACMLVF